MLCAGADGSVLEDCWKLLRNSLLDACSAAPEGNDTALSPDQIAAIAGLFTANLFQHFSLYSYVFTHEQQHTQYQANLMVRTVTSVSLLLSVLYALIGLCAHEQKGNRTVVI